MSSSQPQRIAVVGAGMAGATCARALGQAGHAVHVFDKSQGPGGRLATRRMVWCDADRMACTTRLDHGAIGITARSAAFRVFLDAGVARGELVDWSPALAPGSRPLDDGPSFVLPVPGMPELCRRLLDGVASTWSCTVDRLTRLPSGWRVEADDAVLGADPFDAVLLALPPAQAAPLLRPHRGDWADAAAATPMQPCWTLLGVAHDADPTAAPAWDLARPPAGALAWVVRQDHRPGRARVAGQAHWVVHAKAEWSAARLEQPAAEVQAQLQAALDEVLGAPVAWLHCTVHRWRYALPPSDVLAPAAAACRWDADLGLGVCGDFLGGAGVEGAWQSAQAMSAALLQRAPEVSNALKRGPGHTPTGDLPAASR